MAMSEKSLQLHLYFFLNRRQEVSITNPLNLIVQFRNNSKIKSD